jgi:hypothetical protein
MTATGSTAHRRRERAVLERDGHVTVRGLLGADEVARFKDIVEDAVSLTDKLELPPGNDLYQRAFDQYMNLWQLGGDVGAAVGELTLHHDLARTAADLLGVDAVRLYHDQALFKVSGGGHTPWHQDQWYWPLDTDRTITMWLPLHDVTAAMGDLEFAIGSHRGPIGDEPISGASDEFYERHLESRSMSRARTGDLSAGDASFHLGWTLHRAAGNSTTTDRKVMTIIWFADGARVIEPQNAGQALDRRMWLGNADPGQPAASAINPVVAA